MTQPKNKTSSWIIKKNRVIFFLNLHPLRRRRGGPKDSFGGEWFSRRDAFGKTSSLSRRDSFGAKLRNKTIMFFAYILKSLKDGKHYYGSTDDLSYRLEYHNKGKVKSTKSRRPFVLHYNEVFNTRKEAMKRERFFKSIDY